MEIERYNRDDPQYKVTPYGAPPEREKRKLTPELDKATAAFSPIQTFAKSAANAATFGQHNRLQAWKSGTSLADETEFDQRVREQNPKSALAGDVTGSVLQAIPMSAGAAATVPAFAANTARSALMREGTLGLLSSAVGEGVKSAEGRGNFDVGNVLKGGVTGAVGGAVGQQLPVLAGHAGTILSKTRSAPLSPAQRASLTAAGQEGERLGATGNGALDLAQRARWTEDPGMAEMAANIERIKGRAGPAAMRPQEDAFRASGFDRALESSVRQQAVRGPNRGAYRQYPEMTGQAVGQSQNAIPRETVLNPQGPIPQAAQNALDESFRRRDALWQTQNARGTWATTGPNPGPRPQPQRNEFKMWEDVLSPRTNPMSRGDLATTRRALEPLDPMLGARMRIEQRADDLARVRGAVRDAPATPEWMPDTLPIGLSVGSVPGLRRVPVLGGVRLGVDVPFNRLPARHMRATELQRNPAMDATIGRTTGAQTGSAAVGRLTMDEILKRLEGL